MKVSEQIKEVVKHNDITITELANNIGTSQANLANKLVRDNFKLSDIQEITKGLGYNELEIVMRSNHETVVISENEPIKIDSITPYKKCNSNDAIREEAISYNIKKNSTKNLDDPKQIERINLLCQSPQLNPHINIIYNIIQSLYIAQTSYDSLFSAYEAAPDLFDIEDTIPIYETCEQEVLKALEQHINSNTHKGFLKEYLDWKHGGIPDEEDN